MFSKYLLTIWIFLIIVGLGVMLAKETLQPNDLNSSTHPPTTRGGEELYNLPTIVIKESISDSCTTELSKEGGLGKEIYTEFNKMCIAGSEYVLVISYNPNNLTIQASGMVPTGKKCDCENARYKVLKELNK